MVFSPQNTCLDIREADFKNVSSFKGKLDARDVGNHFTAWVWNAADNVADQTEILKCLAASWRFSLHQRGDCLFEDHVREAEVRIAELECGKRIIVALFGGWHDQDLITDGNRVHVADVLIAV